MPSVLFLNRFAWPDHAATGQLLGDLAEDLARAGWQVTVVAGRARYDGGGALPREERHAGVRFLRVGPARQDRHGTVARIAAYAGYFSGAARRLATLPRPDVMVAMTDPPFLHGLALALGSIRRLPTVCWAQDLYPEVAVRLGLLRRGSLAQRALVVLAAFLARRCRHIVVLAPAMARAAVAAGAPAGRVSVIHNWADARAVRPVPREGNPLRRELGLDGRFVVLYSGNIGRAHAFGALVDAIEALRADGDVAFVFVGGGNQLPGLRAALDARSCENVRFLDYFPREQLALSLSLADVSVVTEAPEAIGCLVPCKTYGVLASGRPLLFVGSEESDVAAIVRSAGCGVVLSPTDPEGIAAAIRRLRDRPGEAAAMGARAREAAETLYDRRLATRRWDELLLRVLTDAERSGAVAGEGGPLPLAAGAGAGSRRRPLWNTARTDSAEC